jgi:deoxyribonucleoside regulator
MRSDSLDRDVDFRSLSIEQRELLMIQAAKRYYDLNMTIGELSVELGLTRWQARRLLNDARESGIVRIEIVPRTARSPDLESRLQRVFGLREAVVVRGQIDDDEALALDGVAQAAAQFIASIGPMPLYRRILGPDDERSRAPTSTPLERWRRGRAAQRGHEHPLAVRAHEQHR